METIVRDLMTSPAVTCAADDTLTSAAVVMQKAETGSVVVTDHGKVVGILTERDLLRPHDAPPATRVFEATGDPEAFTKLAARFLGPAVTGVEPVRHTHVS